MDVKMHSLLLLALGLAGCTAPLSRTITITTEPPGARVFYGVGPTEGYAKPTGLIGTAPCTWSPPKDKQGRMQVPTMTVYSAFVPALLVLEAQWTNGATARRVFECSTLMKSEDTLPETVLLISTNRP